MGSIDCMEGKKNTLTQGHTILSAAHKKSVSSEKLNMKSKLPYYVAGKVVKGFGRGSKSLGIPTANYEQSVVDQLPEELTKGIYYGWAQIDQSPIFKCCLSIGWNPYFGNIVKSMETHVIHTFDDDFYGSILKVCVAGYIRDEMNFSSIDELKEAIHKDIQFAIKELSKPDMMNYADSDFFKRHVNNQTSS